MSIPDEIDLAVCAIDEDGHSVWEHWVPAAVLNHYADRRQMGPAG